MQYFSLILTLHLIVAFSSVFLGYSLFFISRKPITSYKVLNNFLIGLLIITAITGIFLNLTKFSPFHILAIVVLTTLPLAIYQRSKNNILEFKRGLFFNFVGLNLAMVGTLSPGRTIGFELLKKTLNFTDQMSTNSFYTLGIIAIILAIFGIYNAITNPKFFE